MNKKQLILLIVIGVVVGGVGISLSRKEQATWKESAQKMGDKLVQGLDVNAVESLSIKSASGSVSLAKKSDVWSVSDRSDYPANFGSIHDFLIKLLELKVAQPVKAGAGQLARMELTSPDKGTNSGTLVELKDKSGKTLQSLILGKKVMKDSPAGGGGFGGGSFPVGRYVMVGGDPKTVSQVSEAFDRIEPKASEWLDKDMLKVEKIRSVSFTALQETNSWHVTRETENGEWKLEGAKAEEKLDAGKTSGLNYALNSPSFHDVAGSDIKPDQSGLDKPQVVKLETFDKFAYTVKIGKTDAEGRVYVQFTTTADLPKERVAGKDEKPEDKTKLDKEFQDNLKKSQEKLKKEQFHDKWVYVMDKWSVESLIKERRELLAEKKAEGDAAPAPTSIPPSSGPFPKLN